jgi:hypothetical protein
MRALLNAPRDAVFEPQQLKWELVLLLSSRVFVAYARAFVLLATVRIGRSA